MQRSDSPLNKLFDAARQEQSPLSADDVRALLNQPQKQKQRPIMIPILIAGVVITIAGITSSVVLDHKNDAKPQVATNGHNGAATQRVTSPPVTSTENNALMAEPGDEAPARNVRLSTSDVASCAIRQDVEPIAFEWQRDANDDKPALCQIKCVYPAGSTDNTDNNVKVYFATVRANREVTSRLALPSAPVPVLCTDSRGRACSPTDVAFFPSDYTAIAGKLNNLVPVTYEGHQDILAWYEPSTELVQAFPDSMQDELVTLLDIDIDLEFVMPDMPDMLAQQRQFKINSFNIDSMIGVVKSQLGCVDSNVGQNNSYESFRKLGSRMFLSDSSLKKFKLTDSSMKSFRFRMNTQQPSSEVSVHFDVDDNPDSLDAFYKRSSDELHERMLGKQVQVDIFDSDGTLNLDSAAAYYRQFSKSTYTDMKNLGNYQEMLKHPSTIATMRNADSTMKMLQLYYGSDSLCKMPTELLDQHGVERLGSTPSKKVYKIRKKIRLDSTVNDADSNSKQRFQSRIVIKSTTKRNKNTQAVPSVEKLSELTPTSNGAITSTNVYPNPATEGGATMSFVLLEPRTLTLTLLDLNGNVVATLMQDAKRSAGNGQFAFTLSSIPSGMYLATLTTDKGERAMQRLIVQ